MRITLRVTCGPAGGRVAAAATRVTGRTGRFTRLLGSAYINLRLRKALTSPASSSNHSPWRRLDANRLCQYASIPTGSSVLITCTVRALSGSWIANSRSRRPGILSSLANELSLDRLVPQLTRELKIAPEKELRVECRLKTVRRKTGLVQSLAPANPVSTVPILLADPCLLEETREAEGSFPVLQRGPPYLAEDVLLLHVTSCLPNARRHPQRSRDVDIQLPRPARKRTRCRVHADVSGPCMAQIGPPAPHRRPLLFFGGRNCPRSARGRFSRNSGEYCPSSVASSLFQ